MLTEKKIVRVAAVQIAPDLERAAGTLDRGVAAHSDAASKKSVLVVVPETVVAGDPYF